MPPARSCKLSGKSDGRHTVRPASFYALVQCSSQNRPSKKTTDVLLHDLDCAVIQQIHDFNSQEKKAMFDSVRGIFTEGEPPYEGSAFKEKTHIQICICNPNCIKGYFTPISPHKGFDIP